MQKTYKVPELVWLELYNNLAKRTLKELCQDISVKHADVDKSQTRDAVKNLRVSGRILFKSGRYFVDKTCKIPSSLTIQDI
jgi:hypothetical protein